MTVALILLGALIAVGLVLRIEQKFHDKKHPREDESVPETSEPQEDECCGLHITCERDSLLVGVSSAIEYYEDEELDRHAGRRADSYTEEEIEEFRDILLTLRTDEIAGWARSLQLRDIALPECVREELIMIVAEARSAAVTA